MIFSRGYNECQITCYSEMCIPLCPKLTQANILLYFRCVTELFSKSKFGCFHVCVSFLLDHSKSIHRYTTVFRYSRIRLKFAFFADAALYATHRDV